MKRIAMVALMSAAAMPATFAKGSTKTKPVDDSKLTDEQFQEPVTTKTDDAPVEAKTTKDVVPPEYRERYAAGNGTCGDFIATEISSMTKEGGAASIVGIQKENGIPEGKWGALNNGMRRMNLANTLRAAFLRGEAITIGGKQHSLAGYLAEFEGEGDEREAIKLDNDKELSKFIKMVDLQDNDRTKAALRKALGPKPVKVTPEQREAAKAEKKAEREAAAAEKKAAREKATADKKAQTAHDRAVAQRDKAQTAATAADEAVVAAQAVVDAADSDDKVKAATKAYDAAVAKAKTAADTLAKTQASVDANPAPVVAATETE